MKNFNSDTINLYCKLFGYDNIIIDFKNLPSDFGKHEKFIEDISNSKSDKKYLQVSCNCADSATDYLPLKQFIIDLETFSKIPNFLHAEINQKTFWQSAYRFLNNFKQRGWIILTDVRPSLKNFLESYQELKNFHPKDDFKYLFLCDGNSTNALEFYNEFKNICRIEFCWLMYLMRAWSNELLLNYYSPRLADVGVYLQVTNCAWAYDNPLGENKKISSAVLESREKFSLKSVYENPTAYKNFLSSIFEVDEEQAMKIFAEVSDTPSIIGLDDGLVKHADTSKENVNICGGIRFTADNPDSYENTVWIFGGCVVFGYAVEDKFTLASFLQRRLNSLNKNIRVVNLGIWGGNFRDSYARLEMLPLRKGDIVVVNYGLGYVLEVQNSGSVDISLALNDSSITENKFWNKILHCGKTGYEKMAEALFKAIESLLKKSSQTEKINEQIFLNSNSIKALNSSKHFSTFINEVKANCPMNIDNKIIGAIVMNCNPFTLGHRYLIEYASKKVDFLYIFVVEEDRSFFPFKDRLNLVKKGTADIKNVYVTRSGKMMISSITFPGYFVKDNPDATAVDSSTDVEIFARYIAPAFNISIRFAGEEPFDIVTRNYNEEMKIILPKCGITFMEIPRLKMGGVE